LWSTDAVTMADAAAGVPFNSKEILPKTVLPKVSPKLSPRIPTATLLLGIPPSVIIDCLLLVVSLAVGLSFPYGFTGLVDVGLLDAENVKSSLAMAAPLVTMTAYLTPMPLVVEAVAKMNVQNLPLQVFQLQSICNVLAICYGIQIMNKAVLVTNLFGLALQVLFLSGEHYVRAVNTQWLSFSIKGSCFFNIILYVMATISPLTILGHSITCFNIAMFATPLTKLPIILRTKNASSLPCGMTVISVINNGIWTLYALLIQDTVLLLPSILGYLLAGFQVLIILWCKGMLPFDLSFILLFIRDGSKDSGTNGLDGIEMRKV